MEKHQIIIEYLKVVLSWPLSIMIIAALVLLNFKDSISVWLENLKIEYKDATLSSQSQRISFEKDSTEITKDTILQIEPKKEEVNLPEDQDEKNGLIVQWRANAYLWEYLYLNYYLVHHTHLVLDWFYGLKEGVTFSLFDTVFKQSIQTPQERASVIKALEEHYLLERSNNILKITPKGKEYVEYMGNAEVRNKFAMY